MVLSMLISPLNMFWGGGGLGQYVRKMGGTCLRHTPRWLTKSGENFLDTPPPPLYVFVGGKVVGS